MTNPIEPRARHVSSYHVELRRMGAMSAADQEWMDQHLGACPSCAALTSTHNEHRQQFEQELQGRVLAVAAPRPRKPAPSTRRLGLFGLGLLLPAAAGVLLLVTVGRPPHQDRLLDETDPGPDLAVKGGTGFFLAVRRGSRVFRVRPGEALRAHDQMRFVLEHVQHPYVLIASVDGSGQANVYVPYDGKQSATVGVATNDGRVEIPGSIVIDDGPGPERIFALLSRTPLQATTVRQALLTLGAAGGKAIRGATRLDVGADDQVSLLIEKETERR